MGDASVNKGREEVTVCINTKRFTLPNSYFRCSIHQLAQYARQHKQIYGEISRNSIPSPEKYHAIITHQDNLVTYSKSICTVSHGRMRKILEKIVSNINMEYEKIREPIVQEMNSWST